MRALAATLAMLVLLAQGASAAAGRVYTLAVPRAPSAQEELVLQVRTGVLPRGSEIDVLSGVVLLGTVSPFAARGGSGNYTVPLKGVTQPGARLTIRLVLTHFGEKPRAPTPREVQGVKLVYLHVSG